MWLPKQRHLSLWLCCTRPSIAAACWSSLEEILMPFCSSQTNIPNSHLLEVVSIPLKQMELYFLIPRPHVSHEVHLSQSRHFKTGHKHENIYAEEELGKQQSSQKCAYCTGFRKETALHCLRTEVS